MAVAEVLLSLFVISIVLVLIAWYLWYFKFYWYLKNVPRMRQVPLIGGALEFPSTRVMYTRFLELRGDLGRNFWTMLGAEPFFVTSDPNLMRTILSSNKLIQKSEVYKYLHEWIGTGLLTSSGEKWKSRRKMLTPAFHFKIVEEQVDTFNAAGDVLVNKLSREVGKPDVDIYPYITLYSLDIICESAMGINVKAQLDSNNDYVHGVKEMSRIIIERMIRPVEKFSSTYIFTKNYRNERRYLKHLHSFTDSVIRQRRAISRASQSETNEFGIKKKLAFLDLLLNYSSQGEKLSDRDIREEVDTFTFEGHDTSSSGVTFTLYLLANHPKEQEKAFAEIRNIFADDKDRPATSEDLQEMKYLELVIKESMRLCPPVPIIGRELTEDLKYGDFILPKGLSVMLALYILHRDPAIFPEPEAFKPERFLSEQGGTFDYLPFSAGPRNCIGQKFAMFSMKATISKVLRSFELLPVDHDLELSLESILKSKNGVRIKLSERKWLQS